jgi:cell fate regulator YaaT (PSP1 superfamily)
MIKVVGIRFQKAGKIYYFDPCEFDLETGMHAIVETARGVEMGTVLIPPKDVEDEKVIQPLKPVLRIATDEDEKMVEKNKEKEKEAFAVCKEKILKHELDMKLVNAEYTFDGSKLLFYFTADGRIDFRELVKDLAAVFRTRIELRQIGVRDETKILGGIGICGRPLCCKTYLSDFVPVSIKMAKEQSLSLNPTKISGVCGRLMCCLKNEQDTYEYLNSRLPSVGDTVMTKDGAKGEVQSVSVLRQQVKVVIDNGDEKELREYKVEELSFRPKRRKDVKLTEEELKELQALEEVGSVEAAEAPKENRGRDNRDNRKNKDKRDNRGNRDNSENENREGRENKDRRDNRGNRNHQEYREKCDYQEMKENKESSLVEPVEVKEDSMQEEPKTNGEGNHHKKRYDGKKRHFNKNKKRRNHNQAE